MNTQVIHINKLVATQGSSYYFEIEENIKESDLEILGNYAPIVIVTLLNGYDSYECNYATEVDYNRDLSSVTVGADKISFTLSCPNEGFPADYNFNSERVYVTTSVK